MKNAIWTASEFKKESNLGLFIRRNNPYLTYIDRLLMWYETAEKNPEEIEATILLLICESCKEYIRIKSTYYHCAAVLTLYAQAVKRVTLLTAQKVTGTNLGHGLKGWKKIRAAIKPILQGVGGSNGKAHHILQEAYWLEKLIEKNLPLTHAFTDSPSPISLWRNSDTGLNFIDWLREEYISKMIYEGNGEVLWQRLSQGVTYLDNLQREDKKIYVQGGIVYNSRHERFHTGNMETNARGQGWAIFVMAPNDTIYANIHKTDVFHHSSFLSGAAVQSAGEIAVNNGKVVAITSKSGHYCPDHGSFVRILYWLKQHGVTLQGIGASYTTTAGIVAFYDAEEVWRNGGHPGLTFVDPYGVSPTFN